MTAKGMGAAVVRKEDQRFITDEFFPRVVREGNGDVEIRFRHFRTGEAIWMSYHVFNLRDTRGVLVGWGTVSRSIHDRQRDSCLSFSFCMNRRCSNPPLHLSSLR